MEDIIDYKVPFGTVGQMIHPIIVKPKLDEILHTEEKKIDRNFW